MSSFSSSCLMIWIKIRKATKNKLQKKANCYLDYLKALSLKGRLMALTFHYMTKKIDSSGMASPCVMVPCVKLWRNPDLWSVKWEPGKPFDGCPVSQEVYNLERMTNAVFKSVHIPHESHSKYVYFLWSWNQRHWGKTCRSHLKTTVGEVAYAGAWPWERPSGASGQQQ